MACGNACKYHMSTNCGDKCNNHSTGIVRYSSADRKFRFDERKSVDRYILYIYICVSVFVDSRVCMSVAYIVYVSYNRHWQLWGDGDDREIKWHFCVHSTYECSCIRVICMFCAVNVTSIVFVVLLRCNCCYLFSYQFFKWIFAFNSTVHAQYSHNIFPFCVSTLALVHTWFLSFYSFSHSLLHTQTHTISIPACNQKVTQQQISVRSMMMFASTYLFNYVQFHRYTMMLMAVGCQPVAVGAIPLVGWF